MGTNERVIDLMSKNFPGCPICNSGVGYEVKGTLKRSVQCKSCKANWKSKDRLDKSTSELFLSSTGKNETAKHLLFLPLSVSSWKNIKPDAGVHWEALPKPSTEMLKTFVLEKEEAVLTFWERSRVEHDGILILTNKRLIDLSARGLIDRGTGKKYYRSVWETRLENIKEVSKLKGFAKWGSFTIKSSGRSEYSLKHLISNRLGTEVFADHVGFEFLIQKAIDQAIKSSGKKKTARERGVWLSEDEKTWLSKDEKPIVVTQNILAMLESAGDMSIQMPEPRIFVTNMRIMVLPSRGGNVRLRDSGKPDLYHRSYELFDIDSVDVRRSFSGKNVMKISFKDGSSLELSSENLNDLEELRKNVNLASSVCVPLVRFPKDEKILFKSGYEHVSIAPPYLTKDIWKTAFWNGVARLCITDERMLFYRIEHLKYLKPTRGYAEFSVTHPFVRFVNIPLKNVLRVRETKFLWEKHVSLTLSSRESLTIWQSHGCYIPKMETLSSLAVPISAPKYNHEKLDLCKLKGEKTKRILKALREIVPTAVEIP